MQSTGIETFSDQNNSDAAVPAPACYQVALSHLGGSGYLRGDYANIRETGSPARSPTNTVVYTHHQDEFEQVVASFWVTEAQLYLQGLGFGAGVLPPVNMGSQDVRIDQ